MSNFIIPSNLQTVKNRFLNKEVQYIYSPMIKSKVIDVRPVEHKILVYCENGLVVSHELVDLVV